MICTKYNTPNIAIVCVTAAGIKEPCKGQRMPVNTSSHTHSQCIQIKTWSFLLVSSTKVLFVIGNSVYQCDCCGNKKHNFVRKTADCKIGMEWVAPWGIWKMDTGSSCISKLFGALRKMIAQNCKKKDLVTYLK